jgi:hypothetical protein
VAAYTSDADLGLDPKHLVDEPRPRGQDPSRSSRTRGSVRGRAPECADPSAR